MRIFLTGATGFIGTPLVRALYERGDECVVVSRSGRDPWRNERVRVIEADPVILGTWRDQLSGVDVVVNLAGERIVDPPRRWTVERKHRLFESRVATTRNLATAIRTTRHRPSVFVSGSAIGYYGARGDDALDESSGPGEDFLAKLAVQWEEAALEIEDVLSVATLRTGIVLGANGGALAPLLSLFRLGLGGPWGHGRQWWSWIHLADQVALILFVIDERLSGPINLTAPNPVTLNDFAAALGAALRRPAMLRAPKFLMRLALGEAAATLFDLQRVLPKRALEIGYRFEFATISQALDDLLTGPRPPDPGPPQARHRAVD